ncbi:MAG: hypothetical protein HYZ53_24020 [Planctomycetes bacterium]|nr:hypothetical protein [Planctomycetota bacterium]
MDSAFAKFAESVVLFCHITSQVKGEPYPDLLHEKGGTGFPYLVFMDAEGNVLSKHNGPRTVAGFEAGLQRVQSLLDARKKAESGDKGAKIEVALLEGELGRIGADDAQARVKELGPLSKEQQARLDALLTNGEVSKALEGVQRDRAKALAAGEKFAAMKKAGRMPTDERLLRPFWMALLDYAESKRDVALFEEAFTVLKGMLGENPMAKKVIEGWSERLRKLQDAGKDGGKDGGKPGEPGKGKEPGGK